MISKQKLLLVEIDVEMYKATQMVMVRQGKQEAPDVETDERHDGQDRRDRGKHVAKALPTKVGLVSFLVPRP